MKRKTILTLIGLIIFFLIGSTLVLPAKEQTEPPVRSSFNFIPWEIELVPGIWMDEPTAREVFIVLDVYPQMEDSIRFLCVELKRRERQVALFRGTTIVLSVLTLVLSGLILLGGG